MKFEEALRAMLEGKRTKRTCYETPIAYSQKRHKFCFWCDDEVSGKDGTHYGCEVEFAQADRVADDWEIYEEKSKQLNKVEVFLESPFQKSNDKLAVIIDGVKIKVPLNISIADMGRDTKLIQLEFLVYKEDVKEHCI